jgi:hypothetical protein
MKKKILTLVLAVVGSLPNLAFASEETCFTLYGRRIESDPYKVCMSKLNDTNIVVGDPIQFRVIYYSDYQGTDHVAEILHGKVTTIDDGVIYKRQQLPGRLTVDGRGGKYSIHMLLTSDQDMLGGHLLNLNNDYTQRFYTYVETAALKNRQGENNCRTHCK